MGIADRRSQYQTDQLHRADLEADPIAQWAHWYEDAVQSGVVEPNAMAVATAGADGRPDCRFVLVRGADERGFVFFTNLESAKSQQLAENPRAALAFGWMEQHRQVRARGTVTLLGDAEADAYFSGRPRGSQLAAWASAQSRPLGHRRELDEAVAVIAERFTGREVSRPEWWGGWRVEPDEVEFWQGRPNRLHDRFVYRRGPDRRWAIERLWP